MPADDTPAVVGPSGPGSGPSSNSPSIARWVLAVFAGIGACRSGVAHSPTSHGLLHQARSAADGQVASGLHSALDEIGGNHDATAGQVALAWVHHRQQVHGVPVVPIPGTTSVSHLRSNVAAADLSLSDDELRRLDSLGATS